MLKSRLITSLQNRAWIFPALAILSIIVGQLCKGMCSYLEGDILGLDLNVVGIGFYSILLIATLLYSKYNPMDWLMKATAGLASLGMGAELVLVKFQVFNSVYCPKCLVSGSFFVVFFLIVAHHLKKWVVVLLILLGVFFTSLTFSGSIVPSYAAELYPQFGNDKAQTEIIVYSDYFCPACRIADEQTNKHLSRLKEKAMIEFVDVPIHQGSLGYAEAFLYTWFASGSNLDIAIKTRAILFEASKTKTPQPEVLGILKTKGISFKTDKDRAKEIFRNFYNTSIKADNITATPTVVIVKGADRKKYVGAKDILKALEGL